MLAKRLLVGFAFAVALLMSGAAGCRHKCCRDSGVSYAPPGNCDPCNR